MVFSSIRINTDRLPDLVEFYGKVTGLAPVQPNPDFAEFRFGNVSLAISADRLIRMFNAGATMPASNRSVMIEFEVDDVDALRDHLGDDGMEWVTPPTTMPWGNRSALLKDPDGNVVNIFARLRTQTAQQVV